MSPNSEPEPQVEQGPASPREPSGVVERDQWRLAALVDHVEDLIEVATSEQHSRGERLREDIQFCAELDRGVIPLSLIFAVSAALERQDAFAFLSRLQSALAGDVLTALDRVSETLLMITDKDVQATGTMAASVLTQRSLPHWVTARERVLTLLLELVDSEYRKRIVRHGQIFAPLRKVKGRPNLDDLPGLLAEISDALEDLACDRDVFLDNPIELTPKTSVAPEAPVEVFKRARLQSGADLPTLSDELAQITALGEAVGWTRDQALTLAIDLYRHRVMDARSKIGLSATTICNVVTDLNEALDTTVTDIKIDENEHAAGPYTYDWEQSALLLNVCHRGTLTSRSVREERDRILERLRQEKADREATALSKAIEHYQKTRASVSGEIPTEEEEATEIEALASDLNLTLPEAYDTVSRLYGAEGIPYSCTANKGISIRGIRQTIEFLVGSGSVSAIEVIPKAGGLTPFSVDRERGALLLHADFEPISELTFRLFAEERAVDSFALVEPAADVLSEYQDPEEPGSVASERNIQRFIEEFRLAEEHARDSFDVMLEGCPAFRDAVSIQTLRTLVATLNERLGPDAPIDVVTGFTREIPGTERTDHFSVAWLTLHTEPDLSLRMLTFNFSYGEGNRELPPLSDEVLLDWCRHYRAEWREANSD